MFGYHRLSIHSLKTKKLILQKPRNSTGKIEILVLGNSISFIAIRILHSIIERNFPQIGLLRLFPNPSECEFHYGLLDLFSDCAIVLPYTGYNCTHYLNSIPVLVNNMRPDITFTIFHESVLLIRKIIVLVSVSILGSREYECTRNKIISYRPLSFVSVKRERENTKRERETQCMIHKSFFSDPLLREPLLNASTDAAAAGFIKFLQPISSVKNN